MSLRSSEKGDTKDDEEKVVSTTEEEMNPLASLGVEEIKEMFGELRAEIDALKKKKPTKEEEEEYNAVEDYMEVPAVFFCFASEHSVHADVRNNKQYLPPRKFIKFRQLYRYKRNSTTGRGVDVVSVSHYTTRSKAEADWVRSHSRFNIKFFEKLDEARSVDVSLAEKMAEQQSRVAQMNDMTVIERCKAINMNVHSDLERLRKELVQRLAQDDLKARKKKNEDFFKADRDRNGRVIQEAEITKGSASAEHSKGEGEIVY